MNISHSSITGLTGQHLFLSQIVLFPELVESKTHGQALFNVLDSAQSDPAVVAENWVVGDQSGQLSTTGNLFVGPVNVPGQIDDWERSLSPCGGEVLAGLGLLSHG